jgi:hypothetical protein
MNMNMTSRAVFHFGAMCVLGGALLVTLAPWGIWAAAGIYALVMGQAAVIIGGWPERDDR